MVAKGFVLTSVLFVGTLLVSFKDPYLIKRISDKEFRYEFYTIKKEVNPEKNKTYYWFKGGQIHKSEFGFSGELLHDEFKKYYLNNQIAENGFLKKGLKKGIWKTWFTNGKIQTVSNWRDGILRGKYFEFNVEGNLVSSGKFYNGQKHGKWINHNSKDTLNYKNGNICTIVKKKESKKTNIDKRTSIPTQKSSWFKKLFSKKEKKNESQGK